MFSHFSSMYLPIYYHLTCFPHLFIFIKVFDLFGSDGWCVCNSHLRYHFLAWYIQLIRINISTHRLYLAVQTSPSKPAQSSCKIGVFPLATYTIRKTIYISFGLCVFSHAANYRFSSPAPFILAPHQSQNLESSKGFALLQNGHLL